MEKYLVIITGGTIDSHWDGSKDTAVPNDKSVIIEYLKSLQLYKDIEFKELFLKDSRDVTQSDREEILKTIQSNPQTKILITHGTYTMPDTAKFLSEQLSENEKVVLLTGSMTPMKGFSDSDGPFNLGYALAELEHQTPGVYLAMNGKVFAANESAKNVKEGRFYSIFKDIK